MRISAKGRYGLSAMISMAQDTNKTEHFTILSISEKLGISKIYLEQVFALLKRANLVESTKGSNGGYQLARPADMISAYDIIFAIEQMLFEQTKKSLKDSAENIERAMQKLIFEEVDNAIAESLKKVSLYDLVVEAQKSIDDDNFMFFI